MRHAIHTIRTTPCDQLVVMDILEGDGYERICPLLGRADGLCAAPGGGAGPGGPGRSGSGGRGTGGGRGGGGGGAPFPHCAGGLWPCQEASAQLSNAKKKKSRDLLSFGDQFGRAVAHRTKSNWPDRFRLREGFASGSADD